MKLLQSKQNIKIHERKYIINQGEKKQPTTVEDFNTIKYNTMLSNYLKTNRLSKSDRGRQIYDITYMWN